MAILSWEECSDIIQKMMKIAINRLPRGHGLSVVVILRNRMMNDQIVGGNVATDDVPEFLGEVARRMKDKAAVRTEIPIGGKADN